MSDRIISAIESVQAQLTAETGIAFGARLSAADATIAQRGDPLLALGYASLFFPKIHLREGIPFASFATQSKPTPIDCVHVNLLHHDESRGNSEPNYAALGMVLAEAWNSVLHRSGVAGRFKYDRAIEPVVVYEPPAQASSSEA